MRRTGLACADEAVRPAILEVSSSTEEAFVFDGRFMTEDGQGVSTAKIAEG
jgi:hypothetical protein